MQTRGVSMFSSGFRMTRYVLSTAITATALCGVAAVPQAMAQATAATTPENVTLNIPSQPLKNALRAFAEATHLQLVYTSELVAGHSSATLSGSYAPAAALQQLLSGSGLEYRFTSPRVVTLAKVAAAGDGSKVIGTVEVEGANKNSGVNGSTDVTATEGTGSYTTDAMSIGSKTAQSIRETPQSVTVITAQQMQDQNITNITEALTQAPGIEVVKNAQGQPDFYSRGYMITNFMIDGSAIGANPFPNVIQSSIAPSLAEYDHVEVLRGPDGMFAGNGDPGGTVNLTRKKPLDHTQVVFTGNYGSWKNESGTLDVTGRMPNTDGKARARIVIEGQRQDNFYQVAKSNHQTVYGTVDMDLSPSTLFNFGGSYNKQDSVPWLQGLPRLSNGDDLHLPRDTCFCMPWGSAKQESTEVFASLTQKIGPDWKLKVNVTDKNSLSSDQYGYFVGGTYGISPGLKNVGSFSSQKYSFPLRQLGADMNLAGKFTLFGHEHTLVVGTDTTWTSNTGETQYNGVASSGTLTYAQLMAFDPNFYKQPSFVAASYYPISEQKQYGIYGTLKLALLDTLHLSVGARDGSYGYNTTAQTLLNGAVFRSSPSQYQKSGTITPYGGLVWDLNKQWSLYGSYTDIYKVQQNIDITGTLLPPITGSSYEAGTKAELLDNKLKFSLAFYKSERSGLAVQAGSATINGVPNTTFYLPNGKSTSQGIDTELTGQLLPGWQVITSYVYNDNKTVSGGIPSAPNGAPATTLMPQHMFKFWSTYQLPGEFDKWTVGAGVNWQSSTYVSGSVCLGTAVSNGSSNVCKDPATLATIPLAAFSFTEPGHAVVSMRVAYKIDANWLVSLNVNNLFDKVYYTTVGGLTNGNWYGDPRNAMLTVKGTW
jgi:outer-membrane receptor for ferric coprogen and ferric-rhodotorulic acid